MKNKYFYYDETDYDGKVILTKKDPSRNVNQLNKTFIVGGIVASDDHDKFPMKDFNDQKFEKNHRKLFFKHGDDFCSCISSVEVTEFLNVIKTNKYHIHIFASSYLIMAVESIISFMSGLPNTFIAGMYKQWAPILLEKASNKTQEFIDLLNSIDYPEPNNASVSKIKTFMGINNKESVNENILIGSLVHDELIKLNEIKIGKYQKNNEKSNELISTFIPKYLYLFNYFPKETHIFDKSSTLEKELRGFSQNVKILDDEKSELLRASHILVRMIKRVMNFVNDMDITKMDEYKTKLGKTGIENIKLLCQICADSCSIEPTLIRLDILKSTDFYKNLYKLIK